MRLVWLKERNRCQTKELVGLYCPINNCRGRIMDYKILTKVRMGH